MQEIKYSYLYKEYKTNQLIQQSCFIPTILFIIAGVVGCVATIPISSLSFKTDEDMLRAMFMIFCAVAILILTLSYFTLVLALPKKYTIICENYSEYKKFRYRQWEEEQKKWLW